MDTEFKLESQKSGLLIYLFIMMLITVGIEYLISYLFKLGIFGNISGRAASVVVMVLVCSLVLVLGYFLIFLKNHEITVKGSVLTNYVRLFNKTNTVHLSEVRSVKRNFLGEIVLKDENGKTLLTAEKGMTNYARFEVYLKEHNFKEI